MSEVYKAIVAVQGALAKEGIAKDRTCTQGATYKFRGIDDIYNALAPFLAANGLCIMPRMLSRDVVERTSKNGGALFYTTIEAEFDFVSAADGSMHTVRTFGEAMDSGDKGCNKAMSAAYKYAAFQTFCIPTEGDNDTENHTHEVAPRSDKAWGQKPASEKPAEQKTVSSTPSSRDKDLQERVRVALKTIFAADKESALAHVVELTTFTTKDGKTIAGVKDYTKLTGQRLEILCHKLEKEAEAFTPPPINICPSCGDELAADGKCYAHGCPNAEIPF